MSEVRGSSLLRRTSGQLTPRKEGNRIPSAVKAAQHNAKSSFDLAKSLAGAKNLAEVMELQGAYWRKQLDILMAQAEEVRTRRK